MYFYAIDAVVVLWYISSEFIPPSAVVSRLLNTRCGLCRTLERRCDRHDEPRQCHNH